MRHMCGDHQRRRCEGRLPNEGQESLAFWLLRLVRPPEIGPISRPPFPPVSRCRRYFFFAAVYFVIAFFSFFGIRMRGTEPHKEGYRKSCLTVTLVYIMVFEVCCLVVIHGLMLLTTEKYQ